MHARRGSLRETPGGGPQQERDLAAPVQAGPGPGWLRASLK